MFGEVLDSAGQQSEKTLGRQELMEEAIATQLALWQGHKSYAWAGECGFFADYVYHELKAKGVEARLDSFDNGLTSDGEVLAPPGITLDELGALHVFVGLNHVWLELDGKHFDAATPTGVDRPSDLRHFKQVMVEMMRKRDPVRLQQLLHDYTWWREAEALLMEFESWHQARETDYLPN